jgi:probable F420-dependent oxidoreductase
VGDAAREIEALGYDGVQHPDLQHHPFLPCALAAEATKTIGIGTSVAIAFARSPMDTAMAAWDIQELSGGRFTLGLGTQVKAHIVRRFSGTWASPAARMREYVRALRSIWDCFQNGSKLDVRGEHYNFSLMTPYFNPGPIEHPHIPVYVAAVGPLMSRVAGEVCDGLAWHTFHTVKYLREVVVPNARAGAEKAGRDPASLQFSGSCYYVTGDSDEELERGRQETRTNIAFYGSTPAYHGVLAAHGWNDLGEKLHLMSREGKWDAMGDEITEEMLDEFVVTERYDKIARAIKARYGSLASGFNFSSRIDTGKDRDAVAAIVRELKS